MKNEATTINRNLECKNKQEQDLPKEAPFQEYDAMRAEYNDTQIQSDIMSLNHNIARVQHDAQHTQASDDQNKQKQSQSTESSSDNDEQLEEVVGGADNVCDILARMRESSPPPAPRPSDASVKQSSRILYVPRSYLEEDLQQVLKRSYSTGDIPEVVGRRSEFNRILDGL